MKQQHVVLFPLILSSSINRVLLSLCVSQAFVAPAVVCPGLGMNAAPSAVTFSTLSAAPLFEVLSLPGFELPFVLYPAHCLSPELCLVRNCQSPHFNTEYFFLSDAESLSIYWTH